MTAAPSAPPDAADPGLIRAVIFDMDGVVTDTAKLHAEAWKALFDEMLPVLAHGAVPAFDPVEEYRRFVDGRSREDGVRAVLAARGIALPEGQATDGPDRRTGSGMGRRQQQIFAASPGGGRLPVFPSTLGL